MIPQTTDRPLKSANVAPAESCDFNDGLGSPMTRAERSGATDAKTQIASDFPPCDRWSRAPGATNTGWDRSTYHELVDSLGPARTQVALTMFEDQLTRGLFVMRSALPDLSALAHEAHNLVSASGMLGFSELSDISRRLMNAESRDEASILLVGLSEIAARALDDLRLCSKNYAK